MRENLTVTKERVLAAAGKCEKVRAVLKELFPEVFEEEWEPAFTRISAWTFSPTDLDQDYKYRVECAHNNRRKE